MVRRFVVCSDIHGDMQDRASVAALFGFLDVFNPEIRVIAGDLWDFRAIRRGASADERAEGLEPDWKAGEAFAARFFAGGVSNHFLRGNHDERAYHLLGSRTDAVGREYGAVAVERIRANVARWKAKMLPYDAAKGVLKLGKLSVIHGYHAGASAARQHAAVYGNCIFGHVHTIESAPVASLEPAEARSIGCMCRRDMDYMAAHTAKLRWGQGWAYGHLHADGSYTLFQARKVRGRFDCATEFATF